MNIKDPKNKIIIIYNHGQDENDTSPNCTWVSMLRNHASLIDQEVNGKKIMVYNLCSNHLRGDMSKKKDWWYLKPQPKIYEGKHMLDKRVELNLELIEKKISIERLEKIQNILFENQIRMNKSLEGKVIDVLVENLTEDKNKAFGRSEYMTSVVFNGNKEHIGKIVPVKINKFNRTTLFGEIVEDLDKKVA